MFTVYYCLTRNVFSHRFNDIESVRPHRIVSIKEKTMRFPLILTLITVSMWLSGCAARGGLGDMPPERTWTRKVEQVCDGNRDAVLNAVLGALSDYSLKRRAIANGMAVTAWKSTLVPHDLQGPRRVILRSGESPNFVRTPSKFVSINFMVNRRILVSITEESDGKTLVSMTRQMVVTYFGGGVKMNPDVYERLRGDFDTEEEMSTILLNIFCTVSGTRVSNGPGD